MLYVVCVVIFATSAVLSIRSKLLLVAALWLAVTSAVVATFLYALGAHEIAVIELSVGTGLVPVLFVFAISLMGGASSVPASMVPKPLARGLILVCILLVGLMVLPVASLREPTVSNPDTFGSILWGDRGLDLVAQIVLVFAGIISVLNVLATVRQPVQAKTTTQPVQQREATRSVSEPTREKEYV